MSIDFDKIETVRDNLVNALLLWRNQNEDGLWRSTPEKVSETAASFTCSSEAIQALTEAGLHREAHITAERIDRAFFPNNSIGVLPFESSGKGGHIVNQAWATFVLQETRVRNGKRIWPAIKKLIDQQENGHWFLVPNDPNNKVNSPIFNAYCIVALAEFVEFQKQTSLLPEERILDEHLVIVEESLDNAFTTLFDSTIKTSSGKRSNWWPIKHSQKGHPDAPNFEVTLLCLHALTKAGRVLKKDFYVRAAKSILDAVLSGVRKENDRLEFNVEGHSVKLYDRFHDGANNYYFSLYAPLCCVTILSYLKNEFPEETENLVEVVEFFVEQILDNMPEMSHGALGVYSSPETTEISTWASADAVIVLSRVLAHKTIIENSKTAAEVTNPPLATPNVQTGDLGANDYSRFDKCIAIYCPLKEERLVFENDEDFKFTRFHPSNNWFEGEYFDSKLLMYQSTQMGRVPAAVDTLTLLNKLGTTKPSLIISTGICGGIESKTVTQGDVIVPSNVIDLARRKINETDTAGRTKKTIVASIRPDPINLDPRLADFATRTFDLTNWRYKCSKLLDKKDRTNDHPNYIPSIRTMDILCSDEVVASENWVTETLLDVWENA